MFESHYPTAAPDWVICGDRLDSNYTGISAKETAPNRLPIAANCVAT
jgi:hypothetical protein